MNGRLSYLISFFISISINASLLVATVSYFGGADKGSEKQATRLTIVPQKPEPPAEPPAVVPKWTLPELPPAADKRPAHKPVKKLTKKKQLKRPKKKTPKKLPTPTAPLLSAPAITAAAVAASVPAPADEEPQPYVYPIHAPVSNSLYESTSAITQQQQKAGYLAYIKALIQKGDKIYPMEARMMEMEGAVTLSFSLAQDGAILTVAVTESSGFDTLDQAARAYVLKFKRFKKLPFPTSSTGAVFSVRLEYKLTD